MSQIEEIRAFVTVVETGSLTQAAERLGIAVSAVSRRLKDLELRLGAPLIQRSTRRMYLNETGQRFFNRCRTILDELEAAQEEVQNTGSILSGVLRLNAPLSFGITHIAPLITDFMKENPEVRVDIDLSDKRIDLIAGPMLLRKVRQELYMSASACRQRMVTCCAMLLLPDLVWSICQHSSFLKPLMTARLCL